MRMSLNRSMCVEDYDVMISVLIILKHMQATKAAMKAYERRRHFVKPDRHPLKLSGTVVGL